MNSIYIFNINFIGAYIISILVLGILKSKPNAKNMEQKLAKLPGPIFMLLIVCLVFTLACHIYSQSANPQAYTIAYPFTAAAFLFDGLNLWIHEAGHVYFMWGSKLLHSLGGTLNEVLFPLILIFWAGLQSCRRLSGLGFFWLAFVSVGIGRYIADARTKTLPLLGVDSSGHDWASILGTLNLLEFDQQLAQVVWCAGFGSFLISLYLLLVPEKVESQLAC